MTNYPTKQEVLAALFSRWNPTPETETLLIGHCAGRILAKDYTALYAIPVVRSSKMDGIAVRSLDFSEGMPDTAKWILGEDYVRADTGDDFDDRFDAVIKIEEVTFMEDGGLTLSVDEQILPGRLINPSGSTLKEGALLAKAGTLLRANELAALIMGGYTEAEVLKKPKVWFQPTGSELAAPGSSLQRGQNFDSNSTLARVMLEEMGAEPLCQPIIKDDPKAIRSSLETGLTSADIVILNGGSSKGDEDFNTRLLKEQGELITHGAAAAPGRPIGVAVIDGKPVINLSGPAIAAFYGLDWCIRPLICHFLGIPVPKRPTVRGRLTQDFRGPNPLEFLCMISVTKEKDGTVLLTPRTRGKYGMAEMLCADAMYVTPLGGVSLSAGDEIEAELLR